MKKMICLLIVSFIFGLNCLKAETDHVKMPPGMKNVDYWGYKGKANNWGAIKADWIKNADNKSARCTDVSSANCPLWSNAYGNYSIVYSNPNDITNCYLELVDYIQTNFPEHLSVEFVLQSIKNTIMESGVTVGDDENPTLENKIIIISTF